jgi:hypothetical protein
MISQRPRFPGRVLIGAGLILAGSARAQSGVWDFEVLLDGKPIGSHRFQVTDEGGESTLLSEAEFKVSVLTIPLYRYRHTSRESFHGDCLQSLAASTDENGSHEEVRGSLIESAFVVTTHQGTSKLPPCLMTFDYWNPRMLRQSHLLNPQTGAYLPIAVTNLGPEVLTVGGRSEQAETYLIVAEKLRIKLWYSTAERWLALESPTSDGRLMRYQLR